MERNCDKCIHHTSGMCDSWECKMQTVEDVKKEVREKTIEEFVEKLKESMEKKYRHLIDVDRDGFEWLTTEAVETHIEETLKELKGE